MGITKLSQQSVDSSNFNMIDVGRKEVTSRRAIAQGRITLSPKAFQALTDHQNPKGNVLAQAEIAGILAAKKTSDWIPLCHPIPIEQIKIKFKLEGDRNSILVFCEVLTTAKTGVEMEALAGVTAALLAIYDLSKAIHPLISITDVRLNFKEGGKSGVWYHPESLSLHEEPQKKVTDFKRLQGIPSAVLTVSDRCAEGSSEDLSGRLVVDLLSCWGVELRDYRIVKDEISEIQTAVLRQIRELKCRLIITTGGTGVGPRDVTPEAFEKMWKKQIPGIGEFLRSSAAIQTPFSWLSRSVGGIMDEALVIALPGKPRAVKEGLTSLQNLLPHLLHIAEGGQH